MSRVEFKKNVLVTVSIIDLLPTSVERLLLIHLSLRVRSPTVREGNRSNWSCHGRASSGFCGTENAL